MAGYTIHLAVGKVYLKNNKVDNIEEFERGIIEPDMAKNKAKSHYGLCTSNPNLEEYIKNNGTFTSYTEGYFLHLVTDYLFYNKFLKTWSTDIYNDYDKLNKNIIDRYKITIPQQIEEILKFQEGKTNILEINQTYKFINSVGKINIREIISKREMNSKINICNVIDSEYMLKGEESER